jgi:hypothetical protein
MDADAVTGIRQLEIKGASEVTRLGLNLPALRSTRGKGHGNSTLILFWLECFLLVFSGAYLVTRTLPRAWNTMQGDFPNYYLVARLVRDGSDTSRIYDWTWFQRQKDHYGIDQPLVAASVLTPFSFVSTLPLGYFEPLTAKRIWIITNLVFVCLILVLLRSLTDLDWKQLLLLCTCCVPLYVNFQLGQFYILLVLVMLMSLRTYLDGDALLAGALIGVAAGLKVFPILFVVYFLRKRDWLATAGVFFGVALTCLISGAVFGYGLLWNYLTQMLPSGMRGEALDPYNLTSQSLSSLFHRLFVYEPVLNSHPLFNKPWLFSVAHPIAQVLIFAPAVLLVLPRNKQVNILKLEWSLFTIALMTISTFPASYHFAVLLLPVPLLIDHALAEQKKGSALLIFGLFVAVGFANWKLTSEGGWLAVFNARRIVLLLLLLGIACCFLRRVSTFMGSTNKLAWGMALASGCALSIGLSLGHQRNLFDDYRYRIPNAEAVLLSESPHFTHSGEVMFVGMHSDGYALMQTGSEHRRSTGDDVLSFSETNGDVIMERVSRTSQLTWQAANRPDIPNGYNPVLAPDGSFMVFLRDFKGNSILWNKDLTKGNPAIPETDAHEDVLEAAIAPNHTIYLSMMQDDAPRMFALGTDQQIRKFSDSPDRYPAVSPDGQWLAYSRLEGGVWNLWVTNLVTRFSNRIGNVPCNQITPSWGTDSKTIVYASDCGRGLFLTALALRKVIP